jgi:biopolymer transport protein ExbB/TolQ
VVAVSSLLGSLPTWLLLMLSLAVAWRVSRGGGGSAVSELSKANEVLDNRLHEERQAREELGTEVRDLIARNAALEERTDFATSLAKQADTSEQRALKALAGHEERAIERHEAQLVILDLIARRLGRDPDAES